METARVSPPRPRDDGQPAFTTGIVLRGFLLGALLGLVLAPSRTIVAVGAAVLLSGLVIRKPRAGDVTVTERLTLSRITRDDCGDLVAMLGNPALYQYIGDAPASADEAAARVERWLTGSPDPEVLWINQVARARDDGRLIGLAQATVRRTPGGCEIAYLVDPPEQGRGFGREMMSGFCADLAKTVDPAEFVAHIVPGHAASEGVARGLGLAPTPDRVDGERVWRAAAPRTR